MTKHTELREKPRYKTKEYISWQNMKSRCYNKNTINYKNYGGRGIQVCERWMNSFDNFISDMGECPEGLTLDRIDNDGNYEPDNCRWTDRTTQNINNRKESRNKSGYIGVSWDKSRDRWYACIRRNGKKVWFKYGTDPAKLFEERQLQLNVITMPEWFNSQPIEQRLVIALHDNKLRISQIKIDQLKAKAAYQKFMRETNAHIKNNQPELSSDNNTSLSTIQEYRKKLK